MLAKTNKLWAVIAAGEMRCRPFWQRLLRQAESILCADAGLRHCRELGVQPDLLVGDLDSLGEVPQEIPCLCFDSDKEASDSQLAIEAAFDRGAERVFLLGGHGSRLDHSFANLSLLRRYPGRLFMVDGDYELVVITNSYEFQAELGHTCSLMPVAGPGAQVTTKGLRFGLQDEELRTDSHGLSNEVTEPVVRIQVHRGAVVLFQTWEPFSDRSILRS